MNEIGFSYSSSSRIMTSASVELVGERVELVLLMVEADSSASTVASVVELSELVTVAVVLASMTVAFYEVSDSYVVELAGFSIFS